MLDIARAAATIHAHGGATLRLDGRPAPAHGYAVAPHKDSETIANIATIRDALAAFIANNRAELSQPRHYIGAWIQDDDVYLDVSIVTRSQRDAFSIARAADQLAIYDLDRGCTIYVPQERE
jgi:hypothetical protein